jgi:hypothetical protein
MIFRSNDVRLNDNSVKRLHVLMALGRMVFSQIVFWSKGFRFKFFGKMRRPKDLKPLFLHEEINQTVFTFIIYGIYWKYWFRTKNFEKNLLLKSCFLPIKSHKT